MLHLPNIAVLTPAITRILGCNPGKFTLQGTNTYLVGTGKSRILLDTGEGRPEYAKLLTDYLNITGLQIEAILISHWHHDHTGGTQQILDLVSNRPQVFKMGDPDELPENLLQAGVQPIVDGQIFKVEGATLVSHHTPGHTDDHMVFWLEEEEALFSADNVLGGSTTVFSDLKVYLDSLRKMEKIGSGKLAKIFPGHGPVIYDGPAIIKEYIHHRQVRENQIVDLLRTASEPLSLSDIAADIYKDLPEEVMRYVERGIHLHLDKLLQENKAYQDSTSGDWILQTRFKL